MSPSVAPLFSVKPKPDSGDVVQLNENAELCNLDGSSLIRTPLVLMDTSLATGR